MLLRQAVDRIADGLAYLLSLEKLFCRVRSHRSRTDAKAESIVIRRAAVDRDLSIAPIAPQRQEGSVGDDPVEPRRQARTAFESPDRTEGRQEGLLHAIPSDLFVADETARDPVETAGVQTNQLLEGGVLPRPEAFEEGLVVGCDARSSADRPSRSYRCPESAVSAQARGPEIRAAAAMVCISRFFMMCLAFTVLS